jgi:hypothetical protein
MRHLFVHLTALIAQTIRARHALSPLPSRERVRVRGHLRVLTHVALQAAFPLSPTPLPPGKTGVRAIRAFFSALADEDALGVGENVA